MRIHDALLGSDGALRGGSRANASLALFMVGIATHGSFRGRGAQLLKRIVSFDSTW